MNLLSDNYEAWKEGVEVHRHATEIVETGKAIGIPSKAQRGDLEWLPKSQVCVYERDGRLHIHIMPWLYRKLARS